jgi:nitric oxide dioxygenase
MGRKHVRYGVKPAYFPIMGEALIKTLEEMLGKASFSDEVTDSWRETYKTLADCMIDSMAMND